MIIENCLPIEKNEIEKILLDEFKKYVSFSNSKRFQLIKENISFKNKNSITKKQNKIYTYNRKKNSHIHLSECPSFSQNFFCFPIDNNYITNSNYELKYFENFDNFQFFDKAMVKSYYKIASFYHFFPKTLEQSEIIDNIYYFIWCFIRAIILIKQKDITFDINNADNITLIMNLFCSILNKKLKYFYKIISWYITNTKKKIQIENSKTKPESILQYRKTYCPICFSYLCRQHFYTSYDEVEVNDFLVLDPMFTKTSGERTFFIKKERVNDIEETEMCPISTYKEKGNICKYNSSIKIKEEKHIELFKSIDKNDFYILNCLLSTGSFQNSCFFCRLFQYKYQCITLHKIIMICQNKKYINEIDAYLSSENMGKLSLEKMEFNSIKTKKGQSNNDIAASNSNAVNQRQSYTPCNHKGKCTKENCSCLQTRGNCEKFCFCSSIKCEYAYKGCNCTDGCNQISSIASKSKCRCIREERECDPDICKRCKNCSYCNNMKLYYKIYKKTTVGQSLIIPGAGLFTLEDIKENELVNEYKGELVEKDELERRSLINMAFERNYGFELTDDFDIDALRCGNELRYVNHSSFGYENCYAREIFVRGNNKIALYAKRYIQKGEELYFDYHMKNTQWVLKYNKLYDSSCDDHHH